MLAQLTDRTWLWIAAGFYFAGFAHGTIALLRNGRPSAPATYGLIAIGYIVQLIGLGIRGRAVGGCPLGNTFEIFQFTAWSAITLYLLVGVTFRNSLLGYFTSCLTATLTLLSLAIPAWDATQRIHIFGSNPWIELHAALAVFSYGVFGLLALTSLMFLMRNYSLKSKHLGGWFSFLPSILDLDHIGVRLLGTGVAILTTSLAIIAVFWLRDPATAGLVKILLALGVWVIATVAFAMRIRGILLANRFAWACVGLFIAALLSLVAADASRHPASAGSRAALGRGFIPNSRHGRDARETRIMGGTPMCVNLPCHCEGGGADRGNPAGLLRRCAPRNDTMEEVGNRRRLMLMGGTPMPRGTGVPPAGLGWHGRLAHDLARVGRVVHQGMALGPRQGEWDTSANTLAPDQETCPQRGVSLPGPAHGEACRPNASATPRLS